MKNWKICGTLALLMILLLSLPASAHPGRTDSNGGHNSSSGYHYHHGYSAHSHWDMDGDGDIDCPYDFDDKTGTNSGNSSGGSSSEGSSSGETATGNSSTGSINSVDKLTLSNNSSSNTVRKNGPWDILWVVVIMAAFFFYVVFAVRKAKEYIVNDNSTSAKICTGIACCVAVGLMIYNTCLIIPTEHFYLRGIDNSAFDTIDAIGYVFLWWIFASILGYGLGIFQMCTLAVIHCARGNELNSRTEMPGIEAAVFNSANAIRIACAYSTILYALGATDSLTIIDIFI